ncbi:MAG: ABC transporter ATP-binding protein [Firmicutes bacterium HGW-Firmicutes-14]|nr:MAG: ABC transporter ATP-binding protein [Firmicutes bacterium HGW-Firmicutes-14]
MLEVKDLVVYYGKALALEKVSLLVKENEFVALVGPNGAGKTTLLNTISGLLTPAAGEILWNNSKINGIKPSEIVRLGISQCPEGRKLAPEMTVRENLEMGAFVRKDKKKIAEDLEKTFQLFPRLKERHLQLAGTLSGGERQMVAIARSLMSRPRLLMLDEPSLGLAPIIKEKIFEVIREINSTGTTVLLVEQDTQMAFQFADRAYVLETGNIVMHDKPEHLLGQSEFRKAYLGL